ncbi:hypothetical protein ILUMI_10633 [Ignelater luminosus]|uniref:Mutator-like transposase domain-containing protein n=1 Tax=Ignelater luminosus TaxID=2038154 RepID=A0A8K0GBA4_IGNLU|nr:hypothetical protein ILUMI_10633 [Ignelater luminosus]
MRITGIVRKVEKLRKLREDVEYEKIPFLFVAAIKEFRKRLTLIILITLICFSLPEEYLPDLEIEVVPAENAQLTITLSSHPKEAKINFDFVWGSTAISIGKGQAEELFSVIDMSTPSSRFYRKLENDVGRVWEMQLQSEMKKLLTKKGS